jgi:hypothetical protein
MNRTIGRPAWHLLAWSSVAAVLCLQACTPDRGTRTVISVHPDRPDARITVATSQGRTMIEVLSPGGIGSADFEITSGPVPERISLRFLLKGLEQLEFAYGETTVTLSVSSGPGREVRESIRLSNSVAEQQLLSPDSPYWMAVSITPGASLPPTVAAQDGTIEVQAPEDFLRSSRRSFSIRWVDFFR